MSRVSVPPRFGCIAALVVPSGLSMMMCRRLVVEGRVAVMARSGAAAAASFGGLGRIPLVGMA